MAKYNFKLNVVHKKGKELILPDALSRVSTLTTAQVKVQELCAALKQLSQSTHRVVD